MESQIGSAIALLLAEGGIPAAMVMAAWLVARALLPFAERFVGSWERFLTGLQNDIKGMTVALETVGVTLRESAIQQATILHRVEGLDGKLETVRLDVARIMEILRDAETPASGARATMHYPVPK